MENNFLDIIIVGKNEALTLNKCISSAYEASSYLKRTSSITSQIYYIDSHSTDNSVIIAKECKVPVFFAPDLYLTPANGRNTGYVLTHGEYVMFLDADMEVHEEWFEKGIKFLKENPMAGGVAGIRDDMRLMNNGSWKEIKNYYNIKDGVSVVDTKIGGAFLYRRAALDQINGFEPEHLEEEFFGYLCLKIKGWNLYRINKPMIIHWNSKLSSLKSIGKKFIVSDYALVSGSFFRFSIMNNFFIPLLLKYYSKIFRHIIYLFIISLGIAQGGQNNYTYSFVVLVSLIYLFRIAIEKNGTLNGLLYFMLYNIMVVNFFIGLIFNIPKVNYGLRKSNKYKKLIINRNNGNSL